jgi:hypothetical protein
VPTYRITGPDGKTYRVTAPEGTTPEQALERVRQQVAGGGQPAKAPVAPTREERIAAQREADRKLYDPTAGMSPLQRGAAGAGRGLMSTTRAVADLAPKEPSAADFTPFGGMLSVLREVNGGRLARMLGLPETKAEADAADAPLLATTAGQVGNVVGSAAPAALAVPFTPAALPGALAAGAATGAVATEGDALDRLAGAAGGAIGTGAARAVPVLWRAGKGLVRGAVEPVTAAGRDRIAGRALERFATQGDDALTQLQAGPSITGARPTLAEATRDPGLATLQRAIGTMDPEAAALLAARQAENNAARVQTLRSVAGEAEAPVQSRVGALRRIQQGPSRQAAEDAREASATAGYGAAYEAGIDPRVAQMMAPQVEQLMSRPSMQQAMTQARRLAAEEGLALNDATSVQGLHYAKQALDDMIEQAVRAGDRNHARLLTQTARDLSSTLDELSPAYQAARATFRNQSVPINRQDVAARLADRAGTAVRDLSGNPRLRAQQFASAMNDEAGLIEQATGQRGASALDDLLTPTQAGRVRAVRDELELLANLDSAAAGPGAHTAKMLASQNLVRQVAGPLGLPESFAEGVLSQTAMRPVQWAYKSAEPRIGARIADALLDPEAAAALVRGARTFDMRRAPSQLDLLLQRSTPWAAGYLSGQAASQ